MPFNYRPAVISEALQLSILFQQVYIHIYGLEGVSKEFAHFMDQQFSIAKIQRDIESDHCTLLVATYKENPVGILQLEYSRPCPIGDLVAPEINKLYVLSHFYGKNVGQELMARAEQILREKGEQEVWLWVLATNARAVRFYEKQNYNWIGNADFKMEENTYENKVMHKKLEI